MNDEFFIGWQPRPPRRLARFLVAVGAVLVLAMGGLAVALGQADEPGGAISASGGGFELPADMPLVEGVVTRLPYPVLHRPDGRALLLAGDGKRGAEVPAELEGRNVVARGYPQQRGSIAMLVLDGPPAPREGGSAPPIQPLGRWRLTGEICDGKCVAGAMIAGTGIAHRACATLCLSGELPAVFVSTAPVMGQGYMLIGGPDGGPLPEAMRRFIALRVSVEGMLERRGGLLVFLADPASVVAR